MYGKKSKNSLIIGFWLVFSQVKKIKNSQISHNRKTSFTPLFTLLSLGCWQGEFVFDTSYMKIKNYVSFILLSVEKLSYIAWPGKKLWIFLSLQ